MNIENEGFERMSIQTRPVRQEDMETLSRILEVWVKDRDTGEPLPDEVKSILDAVKKSMRGEGDTRFVVAAEKENALGMIGLTPASQSMRRYAVTGKCAEIINAFVDPAYRNGRGVGRALVDAVEKEAGLHGYSEILVNSGPRYKDTGWNFYNKVYGEPIAIAKGLYGKGGDAPVWRKLLGDHY